MPFILFAAPPRAANKMKGKRKMSEEQFKIRLA